MNPATRPVWPLHRSILVHSALLFPLVLSGCGLSEYEAKMISAQKHVDDQAKFKDLELPLQMPQVNKAVTVSLRPPKGIIPANPKKWGQGDWLHYYEKQSGNFNLLAVGLAGDRATFKQAVLNTLPAGETSSGTYTTVPTGNHPPLQLEMIARKYSSGWTDYIFFDADARVAILYRVEPENLTQTTTNLMHQSLNSLIIGP